MGPRGDQLFLSLSGVAATAGPVCNSRTGMRGMP
jgi:hypothetical protein